MPKLFPILLVTIALLPACFKDKTDDTQPDPAAPNGTVLRDSARMILVSSRAMSDTAAEWIVGVTCYNPDGSILWQRNNLGNSGIRSPFYHNNSVIIRSTGVKFDSANQMSFTQYNHIINAKTGKDRWSWESDGLTWSSLAARNDTLYAIKTTGYTHWLEAWTLTVPKRIMQIPLPGPYMGGYLTLDGNTIYFINASENTVANINAFDLQTRKVTWTTAISIVVSSMSELIVGKDHIYFKNGTGSLMALSKKDGAIAWSRYDDYDYRIAYNNGYLLATSNNGLFAYNALGGTQLWQWKPSRYIARGAGPVARGNEVFLAGADDTSNFLHSYDATTGTLKKSFKLNHYASDMVISGNIAYTSQMIGEGHYIRFTDINTGIEKGAIKLINKEHFEIPRIVTSTE